MISVLPRSDVYTTNNPQITTFNITLSCEPSKFTIFFAVYALARGTDTLKDSGRVRVGG